jgi:hypothetical protein
VVRKPLGKRKKDIVKIERNEEQNVKLVFLISNVQSFIIFENINFLAFTASFTTLKFPLFIKKHFFLILFHYN